MLIKKTFISCGLRTPIGSFQGMLKNLTAVQLAAENIKQMMQKYDISKESIDSVIIGSVITSGLGQSPTKQASLLSGLSNSITCSTVNKVCGSGLYSVLLSINEIRLNQATTVIAGGMESMSNIPYLLTNMRQGIKFGDASIIDGMLYDGLIDPYSHNHMGVLGDLCSKQWNISRKKQDEFSEQSYKNALFAQENKILNRELSTLSIKSKKNTLTIDRDEEPSNFNQSKISKLKPAFSKDGFVTAFNASKLSDGAASVIVSDENFFSSKDTLPKFEVIGTDIFSHAPEWFTTAPTSSIKRLLKKSNLTINDVGLFEINEAFSVVPIHAMEELNISRNKLNIHGGAISLGHPLGCSGTRILVTLMNAMSLKNVEIGCASICLGGGEAISLLIKQII